MLHNRITGRQLEIVSEEGYVPNGYWRQALLSVLTDMLCREPARPLETEAEEEVRIYQDALPGLT